MDKWEYEDIVNLSHHQSDRRPHMTVYDRAAQFTPFAALVGYDQIVQDTADTLLLERKLILSEDEKSVLDRRFLVLLENLRVHPEIMVIYFDEAANRLGGGYTSYLGSIKKIEEYPHRLVFSDGKRIKIEDIIQMEGKIFEKS